MEEPTPIGGPAADSVPAPSVGRTGADAPAGPERPERRRATRRARRTRAGRRGRRPLALLGGLAAGARRGPAASTSRRSLLGVKVTSVEPAAGLTIADTVVQDVGFVLAALCCAQLGGRVVRAWQFGLRPPGVGWRGRRG